MHTTRSLLAYQVICSLPQQRRLNAQMKKWFQPGVSQRSLQQPVPPGTSGWSPLASAALQDYCTIPALYVAYLRAVGDDHAKRRYHHKSIERRWLNEPALRDAWRRTNIKSLSK